MKPKTESRRDTPSLDSTDLRILDLLQHHGRATFHEIGVHAGLSAPAAKRRVDRLVAIGAIQGFSANVDPQWRGRRAEAFVELYCHGGTAPKQLLAALSQFPEVVFAATVTGEADALVHVAAQDIAHLEETLESIRTATSVERTRSSVLLTRLIDHGRPSIAAAPLERKNYQC